MANIGEALTTRLARQRLEAIKKFIPVRDSVRQKLQLRQQEKEIFTESAEELFKPITTATETVKTAIVGKPDPADPTKTKRGLLQAIEELKQQQADEGAVVDPGAAGVVTVAKETFINKFTEDGITDIKNIPLTSVDELREFSAWIVLNYPNRQEFLKPGAASGMTLNDWRDYVYKVNRGYSRISSTDDTYNFIKTGVIGVNKELRDQQMKAKERERQAKIQEMEMKRQEREEEKKKKIQEKEMKKQSRLQEKKPPALKIDPAITLPDPVPEISSPEQMGASAPDDDFTTPVSSIPPNISEKRKKLEGELANLNDILRELNDEIEEQKTLKGASAKMVLSHKIAQKNDVISDIKRVQKEIRKIGKGYTGRGYNNHICPDNIVNDVSRLEVLIGGRRAGNNSPEIINEAANICQRLFQRGIMDIGVYRGLIDELADGYHSD